MDENRLFNLAIFALVAVISFYATVVIIQIIANIIS